MDNVNKIVSSLALAFLDETLANGGTIEIPSLEITIKLEPCYLCGGEIGKTCTCRPWHCPKCQADLVGVMYEPPYFVVTGGGEQPGTVHGPPEWWVEGVQECAECGFKWEVSG